MIRIEAHLFNDAVFRAVQDATPLTRSGSTTVADIVQLVVPLLVMLLGYSAFAVDRERGTLRLALGSGAMPVQWLTARFTALLIITVLLVSAPLMVLGAIAASVLPDQNLQVWPRLLLWIITQTLYAAIFLGIAVVISLVANSARTALAGSLAAWVLLCVLIPRLLTIGIESIEPTPSYQNTRVQINREMKAYGTVEGDARRTQEFLASKGAKDADDLDIDLRGSMMRVNERHHFAVFDRHFGEFFAGLQRQDRLYGYAGLLSPKVALQSASEIFAATDYTNHTRFVWAGEHYRRLISETMIQALIDNPQHDEANHNKPASEQKKYLGDKSLWERVPAFEFRPIATGSALAAAAVPLTILLAWFAVTVIAARMLAARIRL
jgi:ABC-2 type transport system permease protein